MASPNLNLTHLTVSQNNKETTINAAVDGLDDAMNAVLTKTVTGANDITLTATELRSYGMVVVSGSPSGAFYLILPASIERRISVVNLTTQSMFVEIANAGTDAVEVILGQSAMLHSDGTDVYLMAGGGAGVGSPDDPVFYGFRAEVGGGSTAAQYIPPNTPSTPTVLEFENEVFDTQDGYNNNEYEVLSSISNKYGEFVCEVLLDEGETAYNPDHVWYINIQKSTNGGSSWSNVATGLGLNGRALACTGAVQAVTGHLWRAVIVTADGVQIADDPQTFFAFHVIESPNDLPRIIEKTGSFTLTAQDFDGRTVIKLNSAGTLNITVPQGLNVVKPCTFIAVNTGTFTFIEDDTGIGIYSYENEKQVAGIYASCALIPDETADVYYLVGTLV